MTVDDAASVAPRGWHSRGYLPHFDSKYVIQTVTFRLADSLPAKELDRLSFDAKRNNKIEAVLDNGHGACWLNRPAIATLTENALLHFDGTRYRLLAWCIMPNHVHAMLEPIVGQRLAMIVSSWKRFTARAANRLLHRSGEFWQLDYFDRFIRDERHYTAALNYIESNPVQAGLVAEAESWLWSSARLREAYPESSAH